MSLALSADVVIAAEDARFCESLRGWVDAPTPDRAGCCNNAPGAQVARLLARTGREIPGKAARELDVVEECVPAEKIEEMAIAIAREIAAYPMYGIEMVKRMMRSAAECSYTKRSTSSMMRRLL